MSTTRVLRASGVSILSVAVFAVLAALASRQGGDTLSWLLLPLGAFASGASAVVAFHIEASRAPTLQARVSPQAAVAERPTIVAIALQCFALFATLASAPYLPGNSWDLSLFACLLVFSLVSDLLSVQTANRLQISGSFLALVLAMVFLGPGPAALIGVLTIGVGWLRWRDEPHYLLNNLVTYSGFPLVGGLAFYLIGEAFGTTPDEPLFYLLVAALFFAALLVNFALIATYGSYVERTSFWSKCAILPPLLPSEGATALMGCGAAYLYHAAGVGAIGVFAGVLITFQYLLGSLLISQRSEDELERRSKELASFQVGMLSATLRTLDLRDQMTTRHSAVVARYSRAIAQKVGLSRREEELVHIAGLLHDIGKFVLPDHILKAETPLTDEDWALIRRHPEQGADLVSSLDGYGPVAEIILAHHERVDGKGYPRGLSGAAIPKLARIVAVAEAYDAMTAPDSYRTPISSGEAIAELRGVAGTQLDVHFVAVFVELLEGETVNDLAVEAEEVDIEEELESRQPVIQPSKTIRPRERRLLVTSGSSYA